MTLRQRFINAVEQARSEAGRSCEQADHVKEKLQSLEKAMTQTKLDILTVKAVVNFAIAYNVVRAGIKGLQGPKPDSNIM